MGDTLQYVFAGIIVLAAVFALVRALVRAARNKQSALTACAGCKLQDICTKQEKNSAKKCADKVAQVEK